MPLVTEAMPAEGMEVRIWGAFEGERRGYHADGLWWESVDGPDPLAILVTRWEPLESP